MEAFPPYGQKKLQTEDTQRRAELSHEEGDSSQHGTGSPGLPCRDYPRLFRCKRQQIPHLCFRVLWTEVLPLGIERVLTIVHCLLFFLCQIGRALASSVHGILQARILEWVAISFSRGSSQFRDWTQVFCIAGRLFNLWATRETLFCYRGKQICFVLF